MVIASELSSGSMLLNGKKPFLDDRTESGDYIGGGGGLKSLHHLGTKKHLI